MMEVIIVLGVYTLMWFLTTLAAYYIADMDIDEGALYGAFWFVTLPYYLIVFAGEALTNYLRKWKR